MALTAKAIGAVASLAVAGAMAATAWGQPAATDLGALPDDRNIQPFRTLVGSEIAWYRFTVPEVDLTRYLDLYVGTQTSGTEMGLYDAAGNRVAFDLSDGDFGRSALSFGAIIHARPGNRSGLSSVVGTHNNGRDGLLPAGEYYLAVANDGAVFGQSNWVVTGNSSQTVTHGVWLQHGDALPPTELGSIGVGETRVDNLEIAPRFVRWFHFTIPEIAAQQGVYLDIEAEDVANGISDLLLYDNNGQRIVVDTVDGVGTNAALSFGAVLPIRPLDGGTPFDGRNGDLAAGEYYLAVTNSARYDDSAWNVWNNDDVTRRYNLVFRIGDNGPLPAGEWAEPDNAPPQVGLAQVPIGTGTLSRIHGRFSPSAFGDVLQIDIVDPANFTATTMGLPLNPTALYLFDNMGRGIAHHNDVGTGPDQQCAQLTGSLLPGPGTYYLAISTGTPFSGSYPTDSTLQRIWLEHPRTVERAPDGPAAAGTFSRWAGSNLFEMSYVINFTGVQYPCTLQPPCLGDFDRSGGIDGEDIPAFFREWQNGSSCADVDASGGVDGDDITTFIAAWQAGGC